MQGEGEGVQGGARGCKGVRSAGVSPWLPLGGDLGAAARRVGDAGDLRREEAEHGRYGGRVILLIEVACREHLLRRVELESLGETAGGVLRLVDVFVTEAHLSNGHAPGTWG